MHGHDVARRYEGPSFSFSNQFEYPKRERKHMTRRKENIWQLSMWRCSDEPRGRVQQMEASNRKDAKHYMGKDVC